jgi:hypothetical protein
VSTLDKDWLRKRWVDEGLSRKEIVELFAKETGTTITVQAVSMAVDRYDLPKRRNRWDDLLPWRIDGKHRDAKEAKLLRLAGRRRAGLSNPPDFETWLDGWLEELKEAGRPVVAYYPDTEDGFHYHPRVPEDGDGEWDLIRRPEVQKVLDERERATR